MVKDFVACNEVRKDIFVKGAKFAGFVGHSMAKMLSASGGPWTPLGALPPGTRYRLVLLTRHGVPPTTDPFRRLCMELGHLGHLSRPGHRVIILTWCEAQVFPLFNKIPR